MRDTTGDEQNLSKVTHKVRTCPVESNCYSPGGNPGPVSMGGGGARPQRRWAAVGPGRASNTISTPGAASVEGAGGNGGPGCGARGRWRGLAGLRDDAPSRRLAARTARGRAAAHGHTEQPGPTKQHNGAPGTPVGPHSTATTHPGIQKTDIRIGCRSVVELGGFEPPTFSLRTRRATNCAIAPRTHTA